MKFLLTIFFALVAFACRAGDGQEQKPPEFLTKLFAIKIPRIDAEDTELNEFVVFLSARIRENDPRQPPGISLLMTGFTSDVSEIKLTYFAEDARVDEVFREVARRCQVEFHVTTVGVVITPVGGNPFPNGKAENGDIIYTYKGKQKKEAQP